MVEEKKTGLIKNKRYEIKKPITIQKSNGADKIFLRIIFIVFKLFQNLISSDNKLVVKFMKMK